MIICANDGCEIAFEAKTHNQKYHNDECCRQATNKRIMEKYYEKQAQRRGKARFCRVCEVTRLSRYNDSQICSLCRLKREAEANTAALNMLINASLAS